MVKDDLVLMCKDVIVCYYSNGVVKIEDTLPYGLYLLEDADIESRINNITNFQNWCSKRMLTLDRENAKVILNSVGLRQAVTDKDRMNIALKYKCLSLLDCYWVKSLDDTSTWEDVNLFKHSLNEAVPVSLQGKSLTLQNVNCIAQDVSTNGLAPKAWVRTDLGLYLFKGDVGNNSIEREVEASRIINSLAVANTISYMFGDYNNLPVSKCPLYTNEDTALISLEDYVTTHDIDKQLLADLKNIILAAYVIGDSDRHCGNVFFEYKPNTNILRVGPMLDFNHAFEAEDSLSSISLMVWNVKETFQEAVKRLFRTDVLQDKLKLAEMYYNAEPENEYWKFAVNQLKKVVYCADNTPVTKDIVGKVLRDIYGITDKHTVDKVKSLLPTCYTKNFESCKEGLEQCLSLILKD